MRMTISLLAGAIATLLPSGAGSARPEGAQGWVTHPRATPAQRPAVLLFRRSITLDHIPRSYPITVTADNRFILYVNGTRVASGPSAGDVAHWRYETVDLKAYLHTGVNMIGAVVWNGVKEPSPSKSPSPPGGDALSQTAPEFQQTVDTGLRLQGRGVSADISTGRTGWSVKIEAGRRFSNGFRQTLPDFYVAGAPETIDAASIDKRWLNVGAVGSGWVPAVPSPTAARRELVADRLPPQRYAMVQPGTVVRTDLKGGTAFPARAVTVPAASNVKLLIRRDTMVSAYLALRASGGKGAKVKVTYAEALYDAQGHKTDRNTVGDLKARGIYDTFLADGGRFTFEPVWWRTWRYLELDVTTASEPLTLEALSVRETGYPFAQIGKFASSDPELNRIWRIGWRTALVDAHETYMDSAYWEQLQYVGDTRLQMLISYAVAGDPRLAEQAIDAIASSGGGGGALTQGAYPSRGENVIPPFSLLWIGMLDDWRMQQADKAVVTRNLPRMRAILAWFKPWVSGSGLLRRNPGWNFVDWVEKAPGDRSDFPAYSKAGESCLTSAIYLGALQQASALEFYAGDRALGNSDLESARRVTSAIRSRCWSTDRKLFADNPDLQAFSQQMNSLAVLYRVAGDVEARDILSRVTAPDRGIDAPAGITSSSYYFAWYLVRAFETAGMSDRYSSLLATWRDLLASNYTTWPERRGNTRSDTHAWSAHPTADLLGIVAGIRSDAPGYARVRVSPSLGSLTSLDATAATPRGPVSVRYRLADGRLTAVVRCPPGLGGTFGWRGTNRTLRPGLNRFVLKTAEVRQPSAVG